MIMQALEAEIDTAIKKLIAQPPKNAAENNASGGLDIGIAYQLNEAPSASPVAALNASRRKKAFTVSSRGRVC